jgi:signal transduction histidine kinase
MLNVARMLPPQIEPVDIADLLAGMNEIFVCALGPRITITVHIPPDLPFVSVDRNQVEMALLNLAINARDAMPNGGTLAISALAELTLVRLSFEDTGSGMDDLTLGQATDAFFSTKARGRGTGLGLSNIQQLITDLGGRFSIASTPGIGTRIDLRLPVARSRACVDLGAVDSRPSRGQPSPG